MSYFFLIVKKHIFLLFLFYLTYVLLTGIVLYRFVGPKKSDYSSTHKASRFYKNKVGPDRVVLIDDPLEASIVRLDLIKYAKETLDISYFAVTDGEFSKLFIASLIDAANRGVKVRLLLDGFASQNSLIKLSTNLLANHNNIEFKFYDPINILTPWTANNRMHDKYMIADDTYALIGGRNIDDRFFSIGDFGDKEQVITQDRDVLIINTKTGANDTVLSQFDTYFAYVFNHEYAKYAKRKPLRDKDILQATEQELYLKNNLDDYKKYNPEIFESDYDWLSLSHSSNRITLIHNPIERLNKEPWVLSDIAQLIRQAQLSVFIQSPYVVPTKAMMNELNLPVNDLAQVTVLTNSVAINPNALAVCGYNNKRKALLTTGFNIYEYQGPESIHSKALMIDNRITLIGSYNFDARSTYLSTETMVVIDSSEFANHFEASIKDMMRSSFLLDHNAHYGEELPFEATDVSFRKKVMVSLLYPIIHLFDHIL